MIEPTPEGDNGPQPGAESAAPMSERAAPTPMVEEKGGTLQHRFPHPELRKRLNGVLTDTCRPTCPLRRTLGATDEDVSDDCGTGEQARESAAAAHCPRI